MARYIPKWDTMTVEELQLEAEENSVDMHSFWDDLGGMPDYLELLYSLTSTTDEAAAAAIYAMHVYRAIGWAYVPPAGARKNTIQKIMLRIFFGDSYEDFSQNSEKYADFICKFSGISEDGFRESFAKVSRKLTLIWYTRISLFFKTADFAKNFQLKQKTLKKVNLEKTDIQEGSTNLEEAGITMQNEHLSPEEKAGITMQNEHLSPKIWYGDNSTNNKNNKYINNLNNPQNYAISKELESVVGWLNENGKKHNEHDLQQLEEYLQAGFTLEAILYRLKYSLQNARADFWKLLYKILQEDKAKQLFTPEAMQQSDKAHSQRVNRGEAAAAGGYNEAEEISKAKIYKPKEYCTLSDDLPESKQQETLETLLEKVINSAYSAVRGMPRPKQNAETVAIECKRAFQAYNQSGQSFVYSDIGKQAEAEVKKRLENSRG